MTGAETSALMLLGIPGLADDLGLADVTARAESKLLGALPLPLRTGALLWRERLHVDAPGWFARTSDTGELAAVAAAVLEGPTPADPLSQGRAGDVAHARPFRPGRQAGVWYLVARHRDRTLSYRVSRIDAAQMLDERARRPESFDLAAWWSASTAEFDRALLRFPCRVRSPRTRGVGCPRWWARRPPRCRPPIRTNRLGDGRSEARGRGRRGRPAVHPRARRRGARPGDPARGAGDRGREVLRLNST